MIDTLVIPAGGRGLRLKERLGDLPKAMAPIGRKPLIDHQIEWAKKNGIKEVFVLMGVGGDDILSYLFNESSWIRFFTDEGKLGTAGAVLNILNALPEQFVLLYGDLMINAPLKPLLDFHELMGADATLFLHASDHPHDSDLIDVTQMGWIERFYREPGAIASKLWFSNAGLHVINRSALEPYRAIGLPIDFGKALFPLMLAHKAKLAGYIGQGYIKDIGTPERYDQVCNDLLAKP